MRRWRRSAIGLLCAGLGYMLALGSPVPALSRRPGAATPTPTRSEALAVVVAPALNLRSGPGVRFRTIRKLYAGERLAVLEPQAASDWLRVRAPDGALGWVKRAATDCCPAAAPAQPPSSPPSVAATPTPPPLQPTVSAKDEAWFHVDAQAAAGWLVARDPGDPWRWTLTQRERGAAAKRVLVLYTKPSSAYDTAIGTIVQVFAAKQIAADFSVVNMRSDQAAGQQALARAVAARFDLVFSMGSDATAFVFGHFRNGPIPVVSVSSKDPVLLGQARDYTSGSGTNIAYTSLNVPIEVQMTYLKALKPQLQQIGVLYAASNASAIETQVKPLKQVAARYGVQIFDIVVQDDRQAHAELAQKVASAAALIDRADPGGRNSIFWVTGSTSIFNEIATINAAAGPIAVLSAVPDVVQAGDNSAVLSIGVSFASNAHLAAVYGVDILTGKAQAGALKVGTISPPDIAINFRRARATGLKIPFSFFESASTIYDGAGKLVRAEGRVVYDP